MSHSRGGGVPELTELKVKWTPFVKYAHFEQLTEVQSVESVLPQYIQDHVVSWEL